MKKIRLLIVVLTVLLIILVITIMYTNNRKNKEIDMEQKKEVISNTKQIAVLDYFKIEYCMQKYTDMLDISSSEYYIDETGKRNPLQEDEEVVKDRIYNLLSENYIKQNGITRSNIFNYIDTYQEKNVFVLLDLREINTNNKITNYLIYGLIQDYADYTVKEEVYAIVTVDDNNVIFSVEPLKGTYNDINSINIDINYSNAITENEYNSFEFTIESDENICKSYMNILKQVSLGNPEIIYNNYLAEEYKEKRFGDIEDFKNYIKNNEKTLKNATLKKYAVNEEDGYTQYVCIDQSNNYYIFNETEPMKFTILFDTYTINIPQFIEKYEKATKEEKCILNIQKFMDAINSYDYNYAYNCLSEGFKTNYFTTVQDFEEYIESILYIKNEVSYENFEEQSGLYKYKVKITNEENDQESITKTFIVKLNDGTDFEMSFNVD